MVKLWKLGVLSLLVSALVACSSGTGAPPATNLTQDKAWTGDIPSDAQVVSPDEFTAGLASGDQTLISSADLAAQKAARDAQFQQDKAFLQALSNKSPDVQALLTEAASLTSSDGDQSVKLPNGQTVRLYGLGTQLRNAVQAEQLDQSVDNALSDYGMTYDLLPDNVKAQAASPNSLKGKSLAEVKAALEAVNGLLDGQPSPVRPEPNGGALSVQAINPGNGTDQDSSCSAPTSYVKQYWFPLKNFVSPVKNQANRGTCWAFAAIGALESRERVQNNNPVNLSEQFLVNKVKQDWDAEDYEDGYWSEKALDTATSKKQQIPSEGSWTYNPSNSRGDGNDDDAASFHNSCDNYSGTCSDTSHQSRRACTTIVFKFCSYVKVTFSGPGAAPGNTTQIWKNGDSFDLNRYRLLLSQGHVLLASLKLYRGFMDDVSSSGATRGVVSNYSQTMLDAKGKEVPGSYGGHELQIVGFLSNADLSQFGNTPKIGGGGYFIVKNQWGCGVADGGYYYVPADYVQQLFKTLSILNFDARRSDAWTKEQATPGGSQAPSIQIPNDPVQVDLRAETDLAQFFKVSHPVAKSVTLTVTSDKDGTVYNGPWSTDTNALIGPSLKYTFTTAGTRSLNLLARYGSSQASASLNVNVVNTPPTLSLKNAGDAHQSEPYQITAVITDPNEADPSALCASTSWSVTAPDTVSPSTGCQVSVTFGTTGARTVSASTTDSDGATTTQTLTLNVLPPSANPYPKITAAGLYSRDVRSVPPGTVPVSRCVDNLTANNTPINLSDKGCTLLIGVGTPPPRYSGGVTVENPSSEALTYEWTLYVTNAQGERVLEKSAAQTDPSFQLYDPYNSGQDTTPCRLTVKVNAPDPSRSKSQQVWNGTCTYHSSTLN